MNRIINGKRYNTETAQKIGTWETDLPLDHPDFRHEELYRKRSGGYFLHGVGGIGTRWAERTWNGSVQDPRAAEGILPLTRETAMRWAYAHMTPEQCAAALGPTPNGTPEALYVQIGPDLMAGLRAGASAECVSLKAFVERLLRDALDDPNQK